VAADEWDAVRSVVTRPELQVIVSNVTEAGFRADGPFPERLTDLLRARFAALPEGPPLFVIPTELVRDNGPRLAEMVLDRAGRSATDPAFRDWLSRGVRFCSSLVDRITTGSPPPDVGAELEARLGYSDALLTVAEPYSLWAIESDPGALSAAFPIEARPGVVFAPDIAFYAVRKLRLLNGSHTAMAPLALLSGVATVREATEHSQVGGLQRRILFDEIVPGMDLPADEALAFAHEVMDRFRNPWLEHRWEVIATNQTPKLRERVLPSVAGFAARCGRVPQGLALACAASLRFARCVERVSETEGRGWWRGAPYTIRDADLPRLVAHWWAVDPEHAPGPVTVDILQRLAVRALTDATLWGGTTFASVPGFVDAATRALCRLEETGVVGAIAALDGG
jgi:tagaturonate reductase